MSARIEADADGQFGQGRVVDSEATDNCLCARRSRAAEVRVRDHQEDGVFGGPYQRGGVRSFHGGAGDVDREGPKSGGGVIDCRLSAESLISTPDIVAPFPDLAPDSVEATNLQLSILFGATTGGEAFDIVDGAEGNDFEASRRLQKRFDPQNPAATSNEREILYQAVGSY